MRAAALFPALRELRLIDMEEPRITSMGQVKMRILEVGVCGTDRELCSFIYGTTPPGCEYLVFGHEALAEVVETAPGVRGLHPGDLVVPSVRLPCDQLTCDACRARHQDFCSSGRHREHGIKSLHGFMAEYVVEDSGFLHPLPASLREVGVLIEPLTIAEKAFQELDVIQTRLPWKRKSLRALVLGAGPVGLLGAMKLRLAGYDVWVFSRDEEPNPGADVARSIGAKYVSSQQVTVEALAAEVETIDIVYEALGAAQLAFDVLPHLASNGVFIFTGAPRHKTDLAFDTERIISRVVGQNQVILGTVNAGTSAFENAIADLSAFVKQWPAAVQSLITRRYSLEFVGDAVRESSETIKNVVTIGSA